MITWLSLHLRIIMKHLEFVGKSTEYLGYKHVEIINSSSKLSFNVPSTSNVEEIFKQVVENNYDLLMSTSAEVTFEFDSEMMVKVENRFKEQGIELEQFIQETLIKFINQNTLDTVLN